MELSSNINKMRKNRNGMTQFELSESTGITISLISQYENNRVYPSIHNLWLIANALDCLVDELYEEK